MNEEQQQPSPISGEFTKALAEKMITHGTELREVNTLIRQLPNPTVALEQVDRRLGDLGAQLVKMTENLGTVTGSLEKMTGELGHLSQRLSLPAASIDQLKNQLELHTHLFEKPLEKSIHYTHFLGRPFLIGAVLLLIIMGLTILWNRAAIRATQHADNDIKWRRMKLTADTQVLRALEETEKAYLANPDFIRTTTEEEEQRRQEEFEQWQRLDRAKGEIQRLEEKKKIR